MESYLQAASFLGARSPPRDGLLSEVEPPCRLFTRFPTLHRDEDALPQVRGRALPPGHARCALQPCPPRTPAVSFSKRSACVWPLALVHAPLWAPVTGRAPGAARRRPQRCETTTGGRSVARAVTRGGERPPSLHAPRPAPEQPSPGPCLGHGHSWEPTAPPGQREVPPVIIVA